MYPRFLSKRKFMLICVVSTFLFALLKLLNTVEVNRKRLFREKSTNELIRNINVLNEQKTKPTNVISSGLSAKENSHVKETNIKFAKKNDDERNVKKNIIRNEDDLNRSRDFDVETVTDNSECSKGLEGNRVSG